MITEKDVLEKLKGVEDPDLHKNIVDLGFVRNVRIDGAGVSLEINLTTPACPVKDDLKAQAESLLKNLPGVKKVEIQMSADVRRTVQVDQSGIAGVRNFVLVASGKGGVGKSTVAANLAVAMAMSGSRVGLLDADIYGPSIPLLMGPEAQIDITPDNRIIPASAHGIKFVSMGFMAPGDKPLIWRGPMAHHALQQTLFQTQWGDLDYLFLDLPPGTGDVHLTIVQSLQVTGAVIVSTPQDLGLTISLKTYQMFKTTNVRVLGIIENMSYYVCPHCGQKDAIFGPGGVEEAAVKNQIPFLGRIPLNSSVQLAADKGRPIVLDPTSSISQSFKEIAGKLAQKVSIASFEAPKLKVAEIKKIEDKGIKLIWADKNESDWSAWELRTSCPCAACRDEFSGKRILDPNKISKDIRIAKVEPVGHYAVGIGFSDGHSSGIYSFELLNRSSVQTPS